MAEPAALVEIPLFPLNTVLFPGGSLPLRIFEARYIDLVRRCMREDSGFGVVMIARRDEAGDGEHDLRRGHLRANRRFLGAARTGCSASRRAASAASASSRGGVLATACTSRTSNGWPEAPEVALPEAVRRARARPRQRARPGWRSVCVAARASSRTPPGSPAGSRNCCRCLAGHKQHCLELDDPVERLRFLRPLFEITSEPPGPLA